MKAKDLAALAALGVAGFAAYDKFGKKSPAQSGAKAGAKLGESKGDGEAGESEARMNMRDMNEGSGRRDTGGNTEKLSRQERDVPDRIMGRDAAGSRFTGRDIAADSRTVPEDYDAPRTAPRQPVAVAKPVRKQEVEARSLDSTGGPSRYRRNDDSEVPAAPAEKQFTLPGTQSSMGALSGANRPAAGNQAMAAMDRATVPAQKNVGSGNAAMDAFSQVQAVPKSIKYATEAEKARQARIDEKNFDSDLMRNRRQAVVDTVQSIPSRVADIFKPPEKEFQNKTYRDASGKIVRYNKGGAVKKMASGGLASSRMSSKPSTASSRGDGIAQRGKTRGKMC